MLQALRKAVVAVFAAIIFVVTTVVGLLAGFVGALIRSQLPETTPDGFAPHTSKLTEQDSAQPATGPGTPANKTAPPARAKSARSAAHTHPPSALGHSESQV